MPDPRRDEMPIFTDAELDELSIITPEDIERARDAWDRDSGLPGLLDAEAVGGDEGPEDG